MHVTRKGRMNMTIVSPLPHGKHAPEDRRDGTSDTPHKQWMWREAEIGEGGRQRGVTKSQWSVERLHTITKKLFSAISDGGLSTAHTTGLWFSEWKLCVMVDFNIMYVSGVVTNVCACSGHVSLWWQKQPSQTHAVYTHCCCTHDQHQESPNNTITQRERRRVQWQSNKSSDDQKILFLSTELVKDNEATDKMDWHLWKVNFRRKGQFTVEISTFKQTAGEGGRDYVNEKETSSPESEWRIGKRW